MAFEILWEPWTEKNNPGNLCSEAYNGRNYFPLSGVSNARWQEDLCLLWDTGNQSSFLSIHRTQPSRLPPLHTYLPVSPLLPFKPAAPGLPAIPGGPRRQTAHGCKSWNKQMLRCHSQCRDQGSHLLAQEDQCAPAHPWHLIVLVHQEGLEDPALQVFLKGKWR